MLLYIRVAGIICLSHEFALGFFFRNVAYLFNGLCGHWVFYMILFAGLSCILINNHKNVGFL